MSKKKKKAPTRAQKKESRIARARNWLPTYEGTKIVRAYRDKFNVDTICAVRELQEIGYQFEVGYVDNLLKAETARIERLRISKEEKRLSEGNNDWQDDRFYFIAGYTSGGAPYGVTWEEMGLEPYENALDGDHNGVVYRHYDFLREHEKAELDNKLRDDFTCYVNEYRRLPSKGKQQQLIEKAFESCPGGPLEYTKDFNSTFRKIVRKRENKLI